MAGKTRVQVGFKRLGLVGAVPLLLMAVVGVVWAVYRLANAGDIGPFVDHSNYVVSASTGDRFSVTAPYESSELSVLARIDPKPVEPSGGKVTYSVRYESPAQEELNRRYRHGFYERQAARDTFSASAIVTAVAVAWYALCAAIGWVVAGFIS